MLSATLAAQKENFHQFLYELLEIRWQPTLPDLQPFYKALHYVLQNAGKRLRPILIYALGEPLGLKSKSLNAPACAIELIHTYSLIHDDLPAMDNDDLRRGKPSCHKAFNEATAILVGDALQTMAFEILADAQLNPIPPEARLKQIKILAQAAGPQGMIGGQILDLAAENRNDISEEALKEIHQRKTGALIQACADLVIAAAENIDPKTIQALQTFTQTLGLAFQVKDDLLDIEGDTQTLGKPSGADERLNKTTFPKLLGIEKTKQFLDHLMKKTQACTTDPLLKPLQPLPEIFISRSY